MGEGGKLWWDFFSTFYEILAWCLRRLDTQIGLSRNLPPFSSYLNSNSELWTSPAELTFICSIQNGTRSLFFLSEFIYRLTEPQKKIQFKLIYPIFPRFFYANVSANPTFWIFKSSCQLSWWSLDWNNLFVCLMENFSRGRCWTRKIQWHFKRKFQYFLKSQSSRVWKVLNLLHFPIPSRSFEELLQAIKK